MQYSNSWIHTLGSCVIIKTLEYASKQWTTEFKSRELIREKLNQSSEILCICEFYVHDPPLKEEEKVISIVNCALP